MNRRNVHLIFAILIVLFGIGALWRNLPSQQKWPSEEALARESMAAKILAACESESLDDYKADNVAEKWMEVPSSGDPVSEEERHSLAQFLFSFFEAKSSDNPDKYTLWAQSQGYAFEAVLPSEEYRKESYLRFHGRPAPVIYSPFDYYQDLWQWENRVKGGDGFPHRITTGSECFVWYFVLIDDPRTSISIPESVISVDDAEWWFGSRSAASFQSWKPPIDKEEIISRHGSMLYAIVKLGVLGGTGIWFPIELRAYHDPTTRQWYLDKYSHSNTYKVESGLTF